MWEVDQSKGVRYIKHNAHVWCRKLDSPQRTRREWAWRRRWHVRHDDGVSLKSEYPDTHSWEVDWTKKRFSKEEHGSSFWARNPLSRYPSSREWHWTRVTTLKKIGLRPIPKRPYVATGRRINGSGYVQLTKLGMTPDEIVLAERHQLFNPYGRCLEHRLRAVQLYGSLPKGVLVRHFNGRKTDNTPANLLLGTDAENKADHNRARLLAMYWHSRFRLLARKYNSLLKKTGQFELGFEDLTIPDSEIFDDMPKDHLVVVGKMKAVA